MTLSFTKMQAVGNNFVVCDEADVPTDSETISALVERLCNRAFGIGADGVLLSFVNYEDGLKDWMRDVAPLLIQAGLRR